MLAIFINHSPNSSPKLSTNVKIRNFFLGTISKQSDCNCSECRGKCLKCGKQKENVKLAMG